MKRSAVLLVLAFLALSPSGSRAQASEEPGSFVPFDDFLADVRAASLELKAVDAQSGTEPGAEPRELEKMRRHVLSLYEGVEVEHSFILGAQTFDCVPVLQQPALRGRGIDKSALLPPAPLPAEAPDGDSGDETIGALASPLTAGRKDAFGNEVRCDEGTIPMRRVTVEELSRLGTLERFFRKTPFDLDRGGKGLKEEPPYTHKYAHAYQLVNNYGGNSWLNVWSPPIAGDAGQIFSLSQHWYVGGGGKDLQTVEGGWQVYPEKYRTTRSVLFIYWTADAYTRTGCYNLDCGAFVQINGNWALGGWLTTDDSMRGGQQVQIQMQWKLTDGKWWLFLQGDGELEAIGYYPASLYGAGQLSRYATEIDYGGETVGSYTWPPMGSGVFAKRGASQAAYQKRIFYVASETATKWGKLKIQQRSPKCYTLSLTPSARGGSSGTFFYFGGPGGGAC